MKRIDQVTVQRILDAADIVEVVSDFVQLKRRGSGYIGLCPFHNERTPSFSVSKSKGICKCFSCGKGGSPIGFLMELEQMSYNEALRYLAKKYNIEIKEHEMTDKEREEESERESLFAVNDFAMHFFESTLTDTTEGRDVGLAYFRERGINDAMIKHFHLGFSPSERNSLCTTAIKKGFNEKFIETTGLGYKNERGEFIDKFRGRVMYPIHTVAGKVVGFGGRTLRKDKDVAKYINSPESLIYKKKRELYGLYQAKQSIVKKDKCILVEGYMDVISMHQSGIENVVASSGTSLTEDQIRLIHRFTENVTVIYDSDPAGIKASLRGIDMLLAEGLNIKVLLLPEGDDPDSFAQSHSSSEVEAYIAENEQDFIAFKTRILMQDEGRDPIGRARVISSIVRSISMIPNDITRTVYISDFSRTMNIDEKVLTLQVAKHIAERREKEAIDEQRRKNRIAAGLPADDEETPEATSTEAQITTQATEVTSGSPHAAFLRPYELDILRYIFRYGLVYLGEFQVDDEGNTRPMSTIEYVMRELSFDDITFSNPDLERGLQIACGIEAGPWRSDYDEFIRQAQNRRQEAIDKGIDEIRAKASGVDEIYKLENELRKSADEECREAIDDFSAQYLARSLLSNADDVVRRIATEIISDRHQLSKIHAKFSKVSSEQERIIDLVPRAVYNLKEALIECDISDINKAIGEAYSRPNKDFDEIRRLMERHAELNTLKKELSRYLGERILTPGRSRR